MAIYDAPCTSAVRTRHCAIRWNSNINLTGNMYAPTAVSDIPGQSYDHPRRRQWLWQLVAASIAFNGNATFNDSGCRGATRCRARNMCS